MNINTVKYYDNDQRVFCPQLNSFCTNTCICFQRISPELEEEVPAYYCTQYGGTLKVETKVVDSTIDSFLIHKQTHKE